MDVFRLWVKATAIRAVKTGAQTLAALIGTNAVSIVSLDWQQMLGIVASAMVLSVCTSCAGIPEVQDGAHIGTLAKEVQ